MITLDILRDAPHRAEFHYTGRAQCSRTVGPRGGVTIKVTVARVNGTLHTWKRSPGQFRMPVKHGLSDYSAITESNAPYWHRAEDCPLTAPCVDCGVHHTPAEALQIHPVGTMPGDVGYSAK